MTRIEVVDTAVKIGLGAFLGGAFGLLAPFILAIKEALMDRRARRVKHMEDAISMLEEYFTFYLQHAANTCFYWTCLNDGSPELADAKKDFDKDKEVYDAKHGLSLSAMTKLVLLGHFDLVSDIRAISDQLYSQTCELEEKMTKAEREAKFYALRTNFATKRDAFYKRFRECYLEEPELRDFFWRTEALKFAISGDGETFAILTTAADGDLVEIHDRRPVALGVDRGREWIEQLPTSEGGVIAKAIPSVEIVFHPVSTGASSPRNDGPELIQPVAVRDTIRQDFKAGE